MSNLKDFLAENGFYIVKEDEPSKTLWIKNSCFLYFDDRSDKWSTFAEKLRETYGKDLSIVLSQTNGKVRIDLQEPLDEGFIKAKIKFWKGRSLKDLIFNERDLEPAAVFNEIVEAKATLA